MLKTFACAALFAVALAQSQVQGQGQADKTVTKQNAVTATATIQAIDQKTRSITLRSEKGDEDRAMHA